MRSTVPVAKAGPTLRVPLRPRRPWCPFRNSAAFSSFHGPDKPQFDTLHFLHESRLQNLQSWDTLEGQPLLEVKKACNHGNAEVNLTALGTRQVTPWQGCQLGVGSHSETPIHPPHPTHTARGRGLPHRPHKRRMIYDSSQLIINGEQGCHYFIYIHPSSPPTADRYLTHRYF